MSDESELTNSENEGERLNTHHPSSLKTIVIPTVENSESGEESTLTSFRRKLSSSEGSGDEQIIDELSGSSSTRPTHLLKRARRLAREFYKKGELELAVKERVRCVAYARLVYGDGHWRLAKAYGKLGEAYLKRKGFCQQALLHASRGRDELLQGESTAYKSSRESHSSDVLGVMQLVYFVMGRANFVMGEFRKAEQAFKKAEISSKERLKLEEGEIVEMYVKILECLGQVCLKLKKFDTGIGYYETALKQARKVYGKSGKELIPLYQGTGRAYQRGDLDKRKGVEMFEKCYQLAEQNFSKGSVELADSLYSTTMGIQNTEVEFDSNQRQTYLNQCLQIYNDQHGHDHKKTIKVQEELCRLLIRSGEPDEAAGIIKDVITSKMMVFGDPSVSLAESYQLLGTIRLSQGKIGKASKHFEKCQSMLSCVLGDNHKKTIQVTETLDMVKKTPGAAKFQSASEKLKDRPRFNGTVGRSSAVGLNATLTNV